MNKNRVYTLWDYANIDPLGAYTQRIFINEYRRDIKLKSLYYKHLMRNVPNGNYLPESQNISQLHAITVGNVVPAIKISDAFENILVPANAVTGYGFQIDVPGQYFWDSFFINEQIPIQMYILNNDLINEFDHIYCIVIETEELK